MITLVLSTVMTVLSPAEASRLTTELAMAAAGPERIGDLKRGAFFGAQVDPVPDKVRERLKLPTSGGIVITQVIPESTAAAAGFQSGDVILALNGARISSTAAFTQAISERKAGTEVLLDLRRGEAARQEKITLKARPFEKNQDFETVYGAVTAKAGRLRTILTRPRAQGKRPALFLIQGVGLGSIDNPVGRPSAFKKIVDDFTRHGFITLRVDKPGCGDSEGGPARDVDFDTELDGYREALRSLRARDDVDLDRVYVLGHSMGGVMAPLVAAVDVPVRGIIAYGTIARTWTEYWLENLRRQLELANVNPSAIDQDMREEAILATYLYAEKKSPSEVAERHPELRRAYEAEYHRGPLLRRSKPDIFSSARRQESGCRVAVISRRCAGHLGQGRLCFQRGRSCLDRANHQP